MQVQLVDSVKCIIDSIINSENFETPPEVDVTQGSEAGDGYVSKTYAITIRSEKRRSIHLFVKYLHGLKQEMLDDTAVAFQTEFAFYNKIYPAFAKFEETRSIKEPFNNVPKHYGGNVSNDKAPPIVLENLRSTGYTLRDRKRPVDDDHLVLPIKAFAKYHAISYAMKDQEPELYNNLSRGMKDYFTEVIIKSKMHEAVAKCVDQFLESLDPISDAKIIGHSKNLSEVLKQYLCDVPRLADEYSVICQGDCWSNNMMYLYDDKTGSPIDVKLIDWQCQRINSPVLDFSHFFYTVATKEILDNADHYINLYYNTLSERIRELGSGPEKMYPYEIFIQHWKKCSLFGLTTAFLVVKALLCEKDEVPNMLESEGDLSNVMFTQVLKHQDKFIERMKDLTEYFINAGLL